LEVPVLALADQLVEMTSLQAKITLIFPKELVVSELTDQI
jgi:hypothetical protein